MPRIGSSLSKHDKSLNTSDVTPVKMKSKSEFHYCFVCEKWIYLPIEDFAAFGHYTLDRVKELAAKSEHHKRVFGPHIKHPTARIGLN